MNSTDDYITVVYSRDMSLVLLHVLLLDFKGLIDELQLTRIQIPDCAHTLHRVLLRGEGGKQILHPVSMFTRSSFCMVFVA